MSTPENTAAAPLAEVVNETRILVVDDNPATLYSTTRVLSSVGWTALQATSGEEALELASGGVDLVVLDINLPGIDGFEVCRRLRADERTARLPVIHLSATFTKDVDKVYGLQAGADGYLTHPVEPPVLIATVQAFLRARRAELERLQSEARFRAVFENALNGIALLDSEFRFVDANPAMCDLLALSRSNIVGRALREFIPRDATGNAAEALATLESKGYWRGVLPLARNAGKRVFLEWSLSKHAGAVAWLAIVSDMTERLDMEREREMLLDSERSARGEAERANRLKDDFLATLSHELRTPLNAIVGWSELLKLGQLADGEMQEGIEAIERNAKAQSQMISDLLDVSRIISGKMRLDVQLVDFAGTVEAALESVHAAAVAKEITLAKVLDPSAGPIAGDPARLQQIVWNLVSNAVKFTPKGGRVRISLQRVRSHVELTVADNGQGMPSELVPHVFERFHQGDASMSRGHGGLGLGLAIVKQLVELHGGTIGAASEGENQGATFTVTIPLASVHATQEIEGGREREPLLGDAVSLAGVRVLVVDDDEDARRLTARVLTQAGADVDTVSAVDEALAAISRRRPDVLVSDLGMPGRDGFELIREARARGHSFQELPAVALTAFARTDDRRRALMAGFQVHLAKPVDPKELAVVVASLVGRIVGS